MGKRFSSIDNAKGILIYLVVLGHVMERFASKSALVGGVQLWIYFFHMPAFIFLAGLFSKRTVREKRVDRAFGYFLLYCFMKVLFYWASVYVKGADKTEFHFFKENGIPWFCLAMFWWYLITMLVEKLPPAAVLPISLVLGIASGYFPVEGGFLVILRTVCFYPFFYLGYLTDPAVLLRLARDRRVRAAGFLVLAAAAVFVFAASGRMKELMMLFRGRYTFAEIGAVCRGIRGGIFRAAAYIISAAMTLAMIAVVSDLRVSEIGRRTLPIYVFHGTLNSVLIGRFDSIKDWMLSDPLFLHCVVFSVIVMALTLLPPFGWIVRHIMEIPRKTADFIKAADTRKQHETTRKNTRKTPPGSRRSEQ